MSKRASLKLFALAAILTVSAVVAPQVKNPIYSPTLAASNYEVVAVYFYPNDVTPDPTYPAKIGQEMRIIQQWYARALGGKTFTLHPQVVQIQGTHPFSYYHCDGAEDCFYGKIYWRVWGDADPLLLAAGYDVCSSDKTFLLFFHDERPNGTNAAGNCSGQAFDGGPGRASVGDATIRGAVLNFSDPINAVCFDWWCGFNSSRGAAAHELGHAFGLGHGQNTEHSVMYYWWEFPNVGFINTAQDPEETTLKNSPFFNQTLGIDKTSPSVSITSPAAGSINSGKVNVAVSASDNFEVNHVDFYVDEQKLDTDPTSPYEFSWDTKVFSNGQHTLKVTANDLAGNSSSAARTVSVQNTPAASCDTSFPTNMFRVCYFNGTNFNTFLTSTTEGDLASPVYFSASPIRHQWGSGNIVLGKNGTVSAVWRGSFSFRPQEYTFKVFTDDGVRVWVGNQLVIDKWQDQNSQWSSLPIYVSGQTQIKIEWYENAWDATFMFGWEAPPVPKDTAAPTVSITNPTNGATTSGTVTVVATASDDIKVTKVDFLVDGQVKGTDTTSPYSYSWNTTTYPDGTHTLTAKATDGVGKVGTSSPVSVTVNNTQLLTVDLKANGSNGPITIHYNTAATLSWNSTNATSCAASNGWSGSKPTSGSESTGSLTSSKTYTLTCTGPGGVASDSVTVNVCKLGDLNCDGLVNIRDASILVSRWGSNDPIADLNRDGIVNIRDASILVSRWGS